MAKGPAFLLLIALAVLSAGLFGALHNQLSYSVGSAYFHDLKFAQFGIAETLQNRLGAALVGWRASWWMGLIVGLPAFLLGFFTIRHGTRFMAAGISAIGVVILVTLIFAMGGLTLGLLAPKIAHQLPLPSGLSDTDSFLRAALMHEASYFGGFVGLFAALYTVWRAGRAERRARHAA